MTARGLLLLSMLGPGAAFAQQPIPQAPALPATLQMPFDSVPGLSRARLPGDSARADSARVKRDLVTWDVPDSVMQALLERPGYVATRYRGNEVVLQAPRRDIRLDGHGAIERGQTILVADTIFYSDSAHLMRAAAPPADTIFLRDPSQGTSDMLARDNLEYDLRNHRGVANSLSTSSRQTGQTWFVYGHSAAVVGDTTGKGHSTSYAMDGSITSCDLVTPHYHFQSSEIKVVSKSLMVARPAVLYVADVPVLWLPFIFQDMRQGRRSGFLTPRFGIGDIVRTTPTYRREIDNIGYYFAINNYFDALMALDWRSGADAPANDPGWLKYSGQFRYRWLDRFVSGDIRGTYTNYTNGLSRLDGAWRLGQQFSQQSSLIANLNYTTSTQLYHYDALTVAQALAAITSQLAFQDRLGPFAVSLGGSRTQHSGQPEVDLSFPNFSISAQPITVRPGVLWTPSLAISNVLNTNLNSSFFLYNLINSGLVDSTRVHASQRSTSYNVQTPFRFGGFSLPLSVRVADVEKDLPQNYLQYDFYTGVPTGQRTFARTFRTDIYWETGVALPVIDAGRWNVTPSVAIVNADPSSGYWVRTQLSGGVWVSQQKTVQGGIAVQPTFYGFYPGFGPFSRIRHAIQPRLTFAYSPAAMVSDDFLRALGYTKFGYLGGLERSTVMLQLLNTVEAKLRPKGDTTNAVPGGDKVKLLNLNLTPLTYDFTIARRIGRGITTPTFHYDIQSDLLPGFQFSADYSLFSGNPISDTAKFSPYRTGLSLSFNIGRRNNPFATFTRLFGGAVPADSTISGTANAIGAGGGAFENPSIAGTVNGRVPLGVQRGTGWSLSIILTSSRSRPVTGSNVRVFDPRQVCQQQFPNDPANYDRCVQLVPPPSDTLNTTTAGAPVYITPTQTTLRANTTFDLTPHWAVQWTTGYDFVQHRFADNVMSLQREMHDWHAVFAFTQAPNGNFSFNFFISLIAEPDLKFDYNRRNYRPLTP